MSKFAITIRATVTKTIVVDAESQAEAIAEAHDLFTVQCEEGVDEDYNEETIDVERIKAED